MLIFKLIINLGLLFTFSRCLEFLENKFTQNEYKLDFIRAQVDWYNESYYRQFTIRSFKYNRTHFAGNLTFEIKIEMKHDLQCVTQAYKFTSNEFRVFPIRYRLTFCSYVTLNPAGFATSFLANNPKCPLRKDVVYKLHNFIPDASHFPPFIPNGEYKAEVQMLYEDEAIASFYLVGRIYRPIVPTK